MRVVVALTLPALLLAACSTEPSGPVVLDELPSPTALPTAPAPSPDGPSASPPATPSPTPSPTPAPTPQGPGEVAAPRVAGTVTTGLRAPWGLTFLPNGSALVSERDTGRVLRIGPDGRQQPVGTVPDIAFGGEGGLLGLAASPDFGSDRLVYAYHTAPGGNRLVRMPLQGGSLGPPEVLLDAIPAASIHNGGQVAFGPDGLLYVSTGDASDTSLSQNPDSLAGKILRLTPDGDVPAGNPDPSSPVYSLGHRNVQGLAWDAQGNLWASEFGANTWDELNLIRPGQNYGWPQVEGSGGAEQGFVDPRVQWPTDQASPSGMAFAEGTIYLAALRGQRLWAVPVGAGRAGEPEAFLTGELGRLRTVASAPDGSLWLVTNNTDGRGNPREGDDRIVGLIVSPS